jgi:hypothetical protein
LSFSSSSMLRLRMASICLRYFISVALHSALELCKGEQGCVIRTQLLAHHFTQTITIVKSATALPSIVLVPST